MIRYCQILTFHYLTNKKLQTWTRATDLIHSIPRNSQPEMKYNLTDNYLYRTQLRLSSIFYIKTIHAILCWLTTHVALYDLHISEFHQNPIAPIPIYQYTNKPKYTGVVSNTLQVNSPNIHRFADPGWI